MPRYSLETALDDRKRETVQLRVSLPGAVHNTCHRCLFPSLQPARPPHTLLERCTRADAHSPTQQA